MKIEQRHKVALAAWIPLQFVVWIIASLLDSALVKVLRTPDMDYWGFKSSLIYSTGALATLTMAALGVTIIGMVIIYRHQYGSRKTLKHFGIWYAVYLVLTAAIFIIEGSRWDVMGDPPVVACLVVACIYPVMSYLVLKFVVVVSRGEITMEKRVGIAGWIPLQVLMYILYIYAIIMPMDSLSRSLGVDIHKHEVVEVVYDSLVCAVALIGWWMFLRYDYGSRKFWRCCIIGYVVIAVFALVYVVCLVSDLGTLINGGIVMASLCILLYPVISMLGLRVVIGIARINRENELKHLLIIAICIFPLVSCGGKKETERVDITECEAEYTKTEWFKMYVDYIHDSIDCLGCIQYFSLCYIDDDDIPEMCLYEMNLGEWTHILTQHEGRVSDLFYYHGANYIERTGMIENRTMDFSRTERRIVYRLRDGVFTEILEMETECVHGEENPFEHWDYFVYRINGKAVDTLYGMEFDEGSCRQLNEAYRKAYSSKGDSRNVFEDRVRDLTALGIKSRKSGYQQ